MKIFAISLGCAKNSIDTELILGALSVSPHHVQLVPEQKNAEVILINTCGFIESAVQESIDTILDTAAGKNAGQILVVTGCLVQRYGRELKAELTEVDIFHGTAGPELLAEKIRQAPQCLRHDAGIHDGSRTGLLINDRLITTPPWRAFVKIAEGCSNRCTYCLIPSIRGNTVCRPPAEIITEIRELVRNGVQEITLLAQDLTSYRQGETDIAGLVKAVLNETDLPWLRLLYLHPAGITHELLQTMADNSDRLCPYLDIPVQHAASEILKRMGRGYDASLLDSLFSTIRTMLPDAALRTTVMTGFPGETPEHFKQLLEFIRRWKFMHLGCFTYSDEDRCAANRMDGKVDMETAGQRKERIMEVQADISAHINRRLVGLTTRVLIEGPSHETELLLQGRTMLQATEVDGITYINRGNTRTGSMVDVKITDSHIYDLVGEIL